MTNKFVLEENQSEIPTPYPRTVGKDGEIRLPTSWAQRRLWFINQFEKRTTVYNISIALRLSGPLDQQALQITLHTLIQRHESLRTTFVEVEGEPQQVINPEGRSELRWVDLSNISPPEKEIKLQRHRLEEAVEHKFDLQTGPLIRGCMLILNPNEHMLLITMHHIIFDNWSTSILFREFSELYKACCERKDNSLKPLFVQYADYVQWQRSWIQGNRLEKQFNYWHARLEGIISPLELPLDHSRPVVRSYNNASVDIILNKILSAKLKLFAQQHNMSLSMVLYAGWSALLSRLSGQTDIVVGIPTTHRQYPELENLIGLFTNTLALRVSVTAEISVEALLEQVKNVTLEAYEHQDIPFGQLIETLHPQHNQNHTPIVQTMFSLQRFLLHSEPENEVNLSDLSITLEDKIHEPVISDLSLSLIEKEHQISGNLNYATELFDKQTIQRWITYYVILLNEMIEDTQKRVSELRILPESEHQQLIELFNATTRFYPQNKCIHQLFEKQVEISPDAIALISEDNTHLTYAELNHQANQLAHYLVKQGVRIGEYIPILIPRSTSMLIAQLAVLKSGGVYIPLDPTLPTERKTLLINDCQARRVIVVDDRVVDGIKIEQVTLQCFNIQEVASEIALCVSDNLHLSLVSSQPAYVMYTSGSTGVPKGVIIPHRAVNRLVINTEYVQIMPTDSIAHCSNPAFDASTFEIWAALLNGAKVVIVPQWIVLNAEQFAQRLQAHQITVLWLTVGLFTQYLNPLANVFGNLRYLLVGGDIVEPATIRQLLAGNAPQHVLNGYGPTEGTTFSATYLIDKVDEQTSSIPIGRPISNSQIYILDEQRNPVPIGVTGEIYIGGDGVALGYLNRPELTAERFIKNPFSTDPQRQLYKSGDLGRWHADGNIDFVGRNDQQVKMRGYRIELGEIETALTAHEALSSAVVIANNDSDGNKKLIAYVCPTDAWIDKKAQEFNADNLEHWTAVFDDQYRHNADNTDNTINESNVNEQTEHKNAIESNFGGWNNSYTGQPIAIKQMEEWLTGTMQRIERLHPRRLLEIGYGTGLLLYRYAKDCEFVLATDISEVVLDQHQTELKRRGWDHVQLRRGDALSLGTLTKSSFDTLIINSVTQYFPNLRYLETLFKQSLPIIEAGGQIFLGDIRNLDLLTAHITAIEQSRLNGQPIQAGALANRLYRRLQQEQELLLSPTYFAQLPERYPEISRVDILVKRGVGDNEMLRYRYDVVLHKRGGNSQHSQPSGGFAFNWHNFETLDGLGILLQTGTDDTFGVSGIPNARVKEDLALAENLRHWTANKLITPPEHTGRFSSQTEEQIQTFESLLQYAEQCGYQCGVTWSQQQPDLLDVIFSRGELPPIQARAAYIQTYKANYPQLSTVTNELSTELESALKQQLPEYMVPSLYIPLERLPLTSSNKVDKKALPVPNENDLRRQVYVAPRDEVEEKLSQLWQGLLKINQVGIHDNFFTLGGHSLQATRLISSIRNELHVEIPLKSVFEHPTLEQLSQITMVHLIKEKRKHFQTGQRTTQKLLKGDI
ncbi:non-ribosomal peptide synthetase [Xenorhabdus lircayensis]|uniref:Amino acid adenylation domain-containing protein n=1 Tax=Xenorhabdus lircayensis TaxID=2763499 RepID=A0ABS0U0D2_9GAMM|nr:non-ribosomal peptide synthetase [Xenorhabdus lircayensis]MBI6547333.1 amino acid adenylation domain-containing protein [Xenorhabdus lircayensis]